MRGSKRNLECWFLWRGETGEPREKTLRVATRTNNKLDQHVTPGARIEPGPRQWEASAFTTVPSLLGPRRLVKKIQRYLDHMPTNSSAVKGTKMLPKMITSLVWIKGDILTMRVLTMWDIIFTPYTTDSYIICCCYLAWYLHAWVIIHADGICSYL